MEAASALATKRNVVLAGSSLAGWPVGEDLSEK